ncbi:MULTISPECIES: Nif3-like dinuclear metal center hexameric protein [unclassified Undibacterium]|uniref:Nif3-like dinuclear metal center hexameric protein n=1 Tax=unclassified Undibacterium TaxID=2630295 RepID=UPI002AC94605|nr:MULTISPECIES: Nif3-like dinuclear metal center hexameric protein [unclassified Undibacterium]MEB0139738.1 Nif3-like dinuclear metal center hexameric protein [Undibacterium sp. CCC2.1]MEB0172619.1 Nif3-like dinuclear metal center hexameric protein [Undibacterium sp. CCC1.1]MEB0176400.1 Nif3-like dinuclear metal center hexameric protein [Undibacterium sp. CCC3.4]MEB0215742.1 Nif3-like dinuclear metal center hexameric protein [Undibacterium sp. 5I2]WPX45622.1 Nif3-like dinuclear metal center h
MDREALAKFLSTELQVTRVRDYCPNGLQVEGRSEIRRIVSGVTASMALLEAALRLQADAIMVHHGYFWRGEDMRVIGQKQRRLKFLLSNDISLYAYHLPLDMHASLGNNARLGQVLGLLPERRFAEDDLGWLGVPGPALPARLTVGQLAEHVGRQLGRTPLLIGDPAQLVSQVAWCTGAAQNLFDAAITAGASVYLSGEISEPTVHLARESGVAYLACGHHATERYGIEALGQLVAERFGIEHEFVDIDNPV